MREMDSLPIHTVVYIEEKDYLQVEHWNSIHFFLLFYVCQKGGLLVGKWGKCWFVIRTFSFLGTSLKEKVILGLLIFIASRMIALFFPYYLWFFFSLVLLKDLWKYIFYTLVSAFTNICKNASDCKVNSLNNKKKRTNLELKY